MPSFHYIQEAIQVLKALKRAGCPTSTQATQAIIAELKKGRSVRQTIDEFAARHGRQALSVQKT